MRRKILGYFLMIAAAGAIAIAFSIFRNSKASVWESIGPILFALLLAFQARVYLRNVRQLPAALQSSTMPDPVQNDFDAAMRAKLVAKLGQVSGPKVISIQEFLDGNFSDQGAIGPNLWPEHPGIPVFVACFEKLLERDDVESIYAEVAEVEPDDNSWPYSDRVYVFGDISDETLRQEAQKLKPTEIGDRRDVFSPIKKSVRALSDKPLHVLWWD